MAVRDAMARLFVKDVAAVCARPVSAPASFCSPPCSANVGGVATACCGVEEVALVARR